MTLSISWSTDTTTTDGGETTISSAYHILEFDVITSVDHTAESELTEHTVETGAAISDHKRAKPRTIEIEAFVTQTPLGVPPLSGFATRSVSGSVHKGTGPAKATVFEFSEEFDRIQDVEQTLERLRTEAIDLTVETRARTYDNVQLVSFRIPQKEGVDGAPFTLSIREVFRAEAQTTQAPLPREPRGASRSETSSDTEEEETEDDRSLLTQVIELIDF